MIKVLCVSTINRICFRIEEVLVIVNVLIVSIMFYMFVRFSVCYIVTYTYRQCEEPVFPFFPLYVNGIHCSSF